jgi:hypothetical protein
MLLIDSSQKTVLGSVVKSAFLSKNADGLLPVADLGGTGGKATRCDSVTRQISPFIPVKYHKSTLPS